MNQNGEDRFPNRVGPAEGSRKAEQAGGTGERPRAELSLSALSLFYVSQFNVFHAHGREFAGGAVAFEAQLRRASRARGLDGLIAAVLEGADPGFVADALVAGLDLFTDRTDAARWRELYIAAAAANAARDAYEQGEDVSEAIAESTRALGRPAAEGPAGTVLYGVQDLYSWQGRDWTPPHLIAVEVVLGLAELVDEDALRNFALRVMEAAGEARVFPSLRRRPARLDGAA